MNPEPPLIPLARRLTGRFALLFLGVQLLLFPLLDRSLQRALLTQVDAPLRAEASRLLDLSERRKDRILQAEFEQLAAHHGEDQVCFQLFAADGQSVATSPTNAWPAIDAPAPALRPDTNTFAVTTLRLPDRRVRSLWFGMANGRRIRILRTLTEPDALIATARGLMGGSLLLSLLVGTFFAHRILTRLGARLEQIRQTTRQVQQDQLSVRIAGTEGNDEIAALARAFNHMLDRIAALVTELRHLGDDAAHELRTPLTRIRGTVEQLLRTPTLDPAAQQAAGAVLEECTGLEALCQTMLQIARLESSRQPARDEPLDLAPLFATLDEAYSAVAEERAITWSCTVPAGPLTVRGDRSSLQRAFGNCVDNALKFTPTGGRVSLTAQSLGTNLQVDIADTGVGIAPADLPRIFDRFYRADSARRQPGAGLGLALVRAIVQAHHGEIDIASTPGQGTRVTITLPLTP